MVNVRMRHELIYLWNLLRTKAFQILTRKYSYVFIHQIPFFRTLTLYFTLHSIQWTMNYTASIKWIWIIMIIVGSQRVKCPTSHWWIYCREWYCIWHWLINSHFIKSLFFHLDRRIEKKLGWSTANTRNGHNLQKYLYLNVIIHKPASSTIDKYSNV